MIVRRLDWLGMQLDDEANGSGATVISAPSSPILVEQRATEEERMIAHQLLGRIGAGGVAAGAAAEAPEGCG